MALIPRFAFLAQIGCQDRAPGFSAGPPGFPGSAAFPSCPSLRFRRAAGSLGPFRELLGSRQTSIRRLPCPRRPTGARKTDIRKPAGKPGRWMERARAPARSGRASSMIFLRSAKTDNSNEPQRARVAHSRSVRVTNGWPIDTHADRVVIPTERRRSRLVSQGIYGRSRAFLAGGSVAEGSVLRASQAVDRGYEFDPGCDRLRISWAGRVNPCSLAKHGRGGALRRRSWRAGHRFLHEARRERGLRPRRGAVNCEGLSHNATGQEVEEATAP